MTGPRTGDNFAHFEVTIENTETMPRATADMLIHGNSEGLTLEAIAQWQAAEISTQLDGGATKVILVMPQVIVDEMRTTRLLISAELAAKLLGDDAP